MAVTTQVSGTTAALWQFLALFSFVSPLPVLWLGLRDGFQSACMASGIAVGLVLTAKFLFGMPYNVVVFLPQVLMVLTLVKFSSLSRKTESDCVEWYPAGHILAYLIGIAMIALLAQMALQSGEIYSDEALKGIAKEFATSSSIEEQMYETLKLVMYFFPGVSAISTLLLVIGNSALAQKALERKQQNIRPAGGFSRISLPSYYLWVVAAVAGITAFGIGGSIGPNILMVLVLGFFLVGLTLVHELIKAYKFGTITLVVFYLVMITFGWLAALVSLTGLLEPWLRSHPKVLENLKG